MQKMKILLTLDYELFLGSKTGTVKECLIEPMKAFLEGTEKYGAKFTIFVDATYLYKLKEYASEYSQLYTEYTLITQHLQNLQQRGHEIQLHIHPHWFYSNFDGKAWKLDHDHYKLCDFPIEKAEILFLKSKQLLDEIIGKKTIAFRAGGFSTQPTVILKQLFNKAGIKIDSSVCPETYYNSPQQKYNYTHCPNKTMWYFYNDICREDINKHFLEIPITMYSISPLFYWKLVATRLLKLSKHMTIGNGNSVKTTSESIYQRLTRKTLGMATIDGFKSSILKDIYKYHKSKNNTTFCIIGHPKLATPYSINKLSDFCQYVKKQNDEFVTISQYL